MNMMWEAVKFLLIIGTLLGASYSNSSARWLWVKSENLPVECQKAQQLFEEQLITRLNELAGEAISYDSQMLSCNNDQCARARLATVGGTIALFHKSRCIKGQISYELRLNDLKQNIHVYMSSFAIDGSIEVLNQKGSDLADRVIRGPRVKPIEKKEESRWRLGVSTGMIAENVSRYNGTGLQFQIELFQELSDPHFGLRYGLSYAFLSSKSLEREAETGEFGITYLSNLKALSTWFSLGVNFSSNEQRRIVHNRESFNDESFYLTTQRQILNESYLDSAIWIESGLILTSGKLQPHLSLRLIPLSMKDGVSSELSTLFGLRW